MLLIQIYTSDHLYINRMAHKNHMIRVHFIDFNLIISHEDFARALHELLPVRFVTLWEYCVYFFARLMYLFYHSKKEKRNLKWIIDINVKFKQFSIALILLPVMHCSL